MQDLGGSGSAPAYQAQAEPAEGPSGVPPAPERPIKLRADAVTISYGAEGGKPGFVAVRDVSFDVVDGAFVSIVGPSGCGKTSLLNAVMGLVPPTVGTLTLKGERISGPGRDRAMVFQSAGLLPWRTLIRNVTYGAEMARVGDKRTRREDALRFLDIVGLQGKEQLYPHQLSGGMQQRANLARALATNPEMLLLDEPFAALDAYTRDLLQEELERIVAQLAATSLLVTHQINEAVYLSDLVLVMSGSPGQIVEYVVIDEPRPRGLKWREDPRATRLTSRISETLRAAHAGIDEE
jgi:NitT/TauT family transport system ATP-binding protein